MGKSSSKYFSMDLFSGVGGLTSGMHDAGFHTQVAVELEADAANGYKVNFPGTEVIQKDICEIDIYEIKDHLGDEPLHLLAGCPPCQGFSRIRKLNRKASIRDKRNSLVGEYFRMVKELRPLTIMMENVPGLKDYYLFKNILNKLEKLGYNPKVGIVNVKDYGVPQTRKRLVMVGSLLGDIEVAAGTGERRTVRSEIEHLPTPEEAKDPLQKIIANHSDEVMERIRLTPKDGGSWKDLPQKFVLKCHKKKNVGFKDVYGRLRWDDYSTTITGGCLNPSKGRFLHPEQDRVITPREAALLQSFPKDYKFPSDIPKASLALLIGNALPPRFSYVQSLNIKKHLDQNL